MRPLVILLWSILLCPAAALASVRRVHVPDQGVAPDVAVGPSGALYLVYGKAGDAFSAVSSDAGRTFSAPLRLNAAPGTVLAGHERGPKIALGKDETLHVVWIDSKNGELYYTRSTLRGSHFSAPRNLRDRGAYLDEATVAADDRGNVLVAWLDSRLPEDRENPLSLPVFSTRSHDGGLTFSKNAPLEASPPIRACSCCALKSLAGQGGYFEVAYRGAYQNIRDAFVARVPAAASGSRLTVSKIKEQGWRFEGCPMSGPFLHRAAKPGRPGGLWAAWMSDGQVYYASSDDGRSFSAPRTPSLVEAKPANHPVVLVNTAAQVFFAWEEGRVLKWQIADPEGKLLDSGEAKTLPDKSKATGFVDQEGNFCLVF